MRLEPTDRDTLVPAVAIGDVLRDAYDKLRRRWRILAGFLVAAILLALAYVLTATPLYTANGAILLDPRVGQSPDATSQMMPGLLLSDALTVDSELRVLTSREVTSSTIRALGITPEEPGEPSLRQRLTALLGIDPSDDGDAPALTEEERLARRDEALRRGFMQGMDVERAGESFVIDIAYTAADPAFAARAVNTLVREYLRLTSREQTAGVERNRLWLEGRIEELRTGVETSETAIADYRRSNDLLTPEGQLLPTEIALNAAIQELIALRGQVVAVTVQAGQLSEQLETGDIDAVRLPVEDRTDALTGFQARYAELQQQEKELLLVWDESATLVRNVRRQQAQIRELILGEYRQALDQFSTTREILDRQIAATEAVIADLREEYGDDTQKTVELRSLEREAEAKRELYERLLEEYNSASQLLTFDANSARVIAWAVPPDAKSAPQSKQVVLLAVFAGLVLAIGTIFLIEALDGGLRTQAAILGDLGLRFLGVVPDFSSEKEARGPLWGLLPARQPKRQGDWGNLPRAARWLDFAATHPTSHATDTMRMLHAQLSMKHAEIAPEEGGGIVIGITSSVHGEGKTMTAANFAGFLAKRQERTALVDLDLIACGLSRLVGPVLPEANNLSRFLGDTEGAISRMEEVEELPGLALIGNADGSGPASVTPRNAEILGDMLRELRRHFDYVIVDLPPAQGTADTQLLATLCDRLIYAIRWGVTPRDQVASSLRLRGLDRSRIFGVLYTQAPIEQYRSYNRHDVNEYYAA